MSQIDWWSGGLLPYLGLVLFGFLPSEFWRMLAVFVGRSINEGSELLEWVRAVSTALLAGVVANIILAPSGALATAPLAARIGAMALGLAAFALFRRSVVAAVVTGEIALVAAAWWFAP